MCFNAYVQPVDLPAVGDDCKKFHKQMIVSGWGREKPGKPTHDKLWMVKQQCLDPKYCKEIDSPVRPFYPKHMLCVGDLETKPNSACRGDSGGNFNS